MRTSDSALHFCLYVMLGWGGTFKRTFFDVRVFNPHAPSNRHSLSSYYRKHEQIKKRAYEQRIRQVEHASFTPISATGGLANEASTFYKRLASLLASKSPLQQHTMLAALSSGFLPPTFCYPVHQRSSIIVPA